jgi:L-rhamnose-H+ transport protein
MKIARRFKFEHSWFVGMLAGLIIVPWAITLIFCPHAFAAYREVGLRVLITSNLFAIAWGVANVLYGVCVVRIGAALTGAILTGLGVCVGVTLPMIVKGTGLFKDAPGLASPAGIAVIVGVLVMVIGVVLVSVAGFGRDRALKGQEQKASGGFLGGFIMCIIAGVTSAGIALAFVYSQGPIVAAMTAQGAGEIPASVSVWAIGLFGGALVNILYPAFLMTRNKNWKVLTESAREVFLAAMIGVQFIFAIILLGRGMVLLGILGASVGFGLQQTMQILGNQGVGFISGEWRGVAGRPRALMFAAIVVLIVAAVILGYGNTLAKT